MDTVMAKIQIKLAQKDADAIQKGHPEDMKCLIGHLERALAALRNGA